MTAEDITPAPRRMKANPKSASSVCRKEHDAIEGFCDIPPRCSPVDSGEATPDLDAATLNQWEQWAKQDIVVGGKGGWAEAAVLDLVAKYREKAAAAVRDAATIALLNERLREIESKPWDKLSAAMADRLAPIWSRDIEQRVADAERRGREAERAKHVRAAEMLRNVTDHCYRGGVLHCAACGRSIALALEILERSEHEGAAKEQER